MDTQGQETKCTLSNVYTIYKILHIINVSYFIMKKEGFIRKTSKHRTVLKKKIPYNCQSNESEAGASAAKWLLLQYLNSRNMNRNLTKKKNTHDMNMADASHKES